MPDCPGLSLKHRSSVRLFVRGVMSAHAGVAFISQTGTNNLGHLVCGTKSFLPPSLSRRRKPGRSGPRAPSCHSPSCTSFCRDTCAQVCSRYSGLTVASSAPPLQ
jgi:hypothetical protein